MRPSPFVPSFRHKKKTSHLKSGSIKVRIGDQTDLIFHALGNACAELHIEAGQVLTGYDVVASHGGQSATQEDLQRRHRTTRQEEQQTLGHIQVIIGAVLVQLSPVDRVGQLGYESTVVHMEIIHTIIHPIFTLAVRDNYIRINPATGAMAEIKKSHNWEKPKRHALTIAEQTAFIDYMRNHKVYNHWLPLFTVLLGTGCRIGEAIGLRWEDCDFDEGIISINHNMVYRKYEEDEKARFHIVTPKTSAGVRIVPMLSEVKAALQSEWETQKIVGFNESVVDGYTGFIFQNRYGDPLSPHSVNRAIDRICAAYIEDETVLADQEGRDPVLIRHFSAHNLRHTFCTRFCENERNIKVIQEIMGHADIETTMNIYAEATKEKKKESFSNLEGKIKIS